jgi:ribosomal subunit interface protein
MEVQLTTRHTKASDNFKETIVAKLSKMEKFHEKITSCHVVLDSEHGAENFAEIVISIQGGTVAAKANGENMGKAIDEALAKIERQLKKNNEKMKSHKAVKVEIEQ